ncbi:MAG: hypothetical protein NC396_07010 [Bacteroides sp.]|nr:hypothetical protein [Bacteroides sp.]MCM1086102.1 hypothetical protein [Bacteroides sp.]
MSIIDNRKLASWKGDIEPYFKDRIGFREKMINWYTVYNDRAFGEMVHPIYEYGRDGYVFFKFRREVYDEEFVDFFCRYLRRVQDYCTQRGVRFVYVYNPSKTSVYSEFLARGYSYRGIFYSLMMERLNQYGVHYVDNLSYLKELAKKEQVFNPKYDAGHWNDIGAFYGTNRLLAEMAKDFPAIRQHDLSDFAIDTIVEKSLPVSLFIINEQVPRYTLKDNKAKLETVRYKGVKLDPSTWFFAVWKTAGVQNLDVMFFHGSYYNGRTQFYQDRFHSAMGIHNYQNFLNFDYWFNLYRPDYVVLETAEYATSGAYFNKQKLQTKVLNAPYDSVTDMPHQRYPILVLPAYAEEDLERLVKISFEIQEGIAFGYMFVGSEEYDLQINGGRAEITLLKKDFDRDSATVALFQNLDDEGR